MYGMGGLAVLRSPLLWINLFPTLLELCRSFPDNGRIICILTSLIMKDFGMEGVPDPVEVDGMLMSAIGVLAPFFETSE